MSIHLYLMINSLLRCWTAADGYIKGRKIHFSVRGFLQFFYIPGLSHKNLFYDKLFLLIIFFIIFLFFSQCLLSNKTIQVFIFFLNFTTVYSKHPQAKQDGTEKSAVVLAVWIGCSQWVKICSMLPGKRFQYLSCFFSTVQFTFEDDIFVPELNKGIITSSPSPSS